MPFLNRGSKNNSDLPAEVQEYYQSERRERVGIAWLLAGGTLILTLLIAFGLFFGGRWAYNKIAGNDSDSEKTTTQQESSDNNDQESDDAATNGDTSTNDTTGTSSATTTAPSTPAPQPSAAPATTGGPNNLPNTGPTGDDL